MTPWRWQCDSVTRMGSSRCIPAGIEDMDGESSVRADSNLAQAGPLRCRLISSYP